MGRKLVKGGDYKPAVAIARDAKDGVGEWAAQNDTEIGKAISRILRWFVAADPLVQAVVMNRPVPRVKNAYAAALRQLADELDAAEIPKPEAPLNDINIVLAPDQFGKKGKKRTG